MNDLWKLIFVILFICEEITDAQSSDNDTTKYDLTNVLNEAILRLLKSTDLVEKLESEIFLKDDKFRGYMRINNTRKLRPFGNAIFIESAFADGSDLNLLQLLENRNLPDMIRWEFSKNKLHMLYDKLEYWLWGLVPVLDSHTYSYWNFNDRRNWLVRDHQYTNLSITATKLSANSSYNENIFINTSYDHLENLQGIKLAKHHNLSYEEHLKLIYVISLELPSMMRNFFFKIGNFNALLGKLFNLNPKQHIISACADFLTNEQRYYYLLPDINFMYMSFKNITIRGLSNFESYVKNQTCNRGYSSFSVFYTHVRNVRGNMTLDSGLEHIPYFRLNFFIGNLYILFFPKNEEFLVEARDYFIIEDAPQPATLISSWLSKYSTGIIQLIESAMADLMMPPEKKTSVSLSSQQAEMETSFVEILKNFST